MSKSLTFLESAAMNFRFCFEMKPSQVVISAIKLSIKMTDEIKEELKSLQEYSNGRMNGIEKRLLEIVDCQ